MGGHQNFPKFPKITQILGSSCNKFFLVRLFNAPALIPLSSVVFDTMSSDKNSTVTKRKEVHLADAELLESLGYKQEFRREFTAFEVFGIAFSIIGLLPSIASVLFYAVPNGGPVGMVWGWLITSLLILTIGASMAELGSAAPTSGGLYFWT